MSTFFNVSDNNPHPNTSSLGAFSFVQICNYTIPRLFSLLLINTEDAIKLSLFIGVYIFQLEQDLHFFRVPYHIE